MIAAAAVAGWMVSGVLAAVVLGRVLDATEARERREPPADDFEPCTCGACMSADWSQPEHDFLVDQPAEILGDIDGRFWQIADDIRRSA